jgi:hypothetical protein
MKIPDATKKKISHLFFGGDGGFTHQPPYCKKIEILSTCPHPNPYFFQPD